MERYHGSSSHKLLPSKPNMKIRIISRENIKPTSPTPRHLRTHKFSLLDQLSPDNYFPAILFYSQTYKDTTKSSDHLKKSLAKTLTHYYPLAGRVKDDSFIDCDDYGTTFIEANVACDLSDALEQFDDVDMLEKLLPCKANPDKLSFDHTIIAIQVNYFECGGMALALCFRHSVLDATAAANFIKSWATIARGGNINHVIFDYTSIFPPQDLSDLSKSMYQEHYSPLKDAVTKRFVFDRSDVTALRDKISNGACSRRPTRFEAVSAVIWGAVIAATRETNDPRLVARISVNVQKRMNPPLPEHRVGNIYQVILANCPKMKTIDHKSLAGKINESIAMVNDSYARKINRGDHVFLNYLRNSTKINLFGISGWCKLPFYEADFGWGKPLRVSSASKLRNFAVLVDSSDGVAIEAWVGLSKKDMDKFEQDPNILAYASFTPSISP